jgi:hypothetical protein
MADRGVVLSMAAKATSRPEGRPRQVGNSAERERVRTQGRGNLPSNLMRVNEEATRAGVVPGSLIKISPEEPDAGKLHVRICEGGAG